MANKTSKPSLFKGIKPYIQGFQLPLVLALIGATIFSMITVYGPRKLEEMTNLIGQGMSGKMDLKAISAVGFLLAGLYAFGAVINYLQGFIITTVIQRLSQRLRRAIATKINRLPLAYFDSHSQGDTLSRVTNDVDTVGQSLNQSLANVISSVIMIIAVLIMMFTANVILSLVTVVSVFVGFILIMFIGMRAQGFFKAQQVNLAGVNGFVEETYSGHNVVTSYNAVPESLEQFAKLNGQLHLEVSIYLGHYDAAYDFHWELRLRPGYYRWGHLGPAGGQWCDHGDHRGLYGLCADLRSTYFPTSSRHDFPATSGGSHESGLRIPQ